MREYAMPMLLYLKYAYIYLNKHSSKYARILNVSDAVHSVRSLHKFISSYRDRGVFRIRPNIQGGGSVLQKEEIL